MKYLQNLMTFLELLARRFREQGIVTTFKWLYAVGLPYITGDLPLRYSRIAPQLYLGAQHGKRGMKRLTDEGIEAVVNMRDESDDADHDLTLTDYCYIPVVDNTAPTKDDLDKGVAFIREVIDKGDKVYVHCHSGVGRAPTMVAAYLISEGESLEMAVERIMTARPFVRILPEQMACLRDYEQQIQVETAPVS